jgi:OOP family OmpA-OmpF porin
MRARTLLGMLPLAFALASTSALAQDDQRGLYVGLSVGQSKVEIADSFLPTPGGTTASSVSKDETDTGFKIYAGYRMHRNFALEGGWADLGSFKATRNVTAPAVGSLSAEIESSGPYIDALGILPLQQFNLFAKLGAIYATTKTTLSRTGAVVFVPGANTTPEDSEVEFKFGLGASYWFTRNLAIRAEYERFFDVGSDETGEGDIDLISIGITFRF